MTEGKRPGGLTALAVINFVLGGGGVLGTLHNVAMLSFDVSPPDEESKLLAEALRAWPLAWVFIVVGLAASILLLVSGTGYLKQRRFRGRTLGNVYAVVGLLGVGLYLTGLPFRIWTIIDLVYPLLTLFLLNFTFRDDFAHGAGRFAPPPPPPSPAAKAEIEPAASRMAAPAPRGARDRLLTGLNLEHVKMIALYWVRFSLRTGGGLVTLLLVLMVGLSVAGLFFAPVEKLMAEAPGVGHTEGEAVATVKRISESEEFVDVVQRVTGADEDEARYLLAENPAILSAIFLALMWLFPFIACIGSFNQTAGDIGNRGLRFLLLRTERPNILAGRFVGTVGAAKAALALMVVIVLLYIGIKFRIYEGGALVVWGLQGFVAIVMLTVPYIAMCTWISCSMDSAFGALALCLVLTGGPLVLIRVLDASLAWDLAWLQRLIPWGWKYELLSGDVGTRITAYLVMLAFTAFFLFLAFRTFHKRDL